VLEYVEAFNRGDMEALRRLFTPDALIYGVLGWGDLEKAVPIWQEIHEAFALQLQTTELPWCGQFRGHDGARQFLATISHHTEATPEPVRIFSAGPEVVVIGRLRGKARATGRPIDLDIVHLWTVRDQQIVRFAAYIDTPAMLIALGQETGETAP
jgi:ketosteroid isomerase-like protein